MKRRGSRGLAEKVSWCVCVEFLEWEERSDAGRKEMAKGKDERGEVISFFKSRER